MAVPPEKRPETPWEHCLHVAGHILGFLYILVTLLFGPIKSLARWLARRQPVQKYRSMIAHLPPPAGLAVSVLSLGALELSKLLVILAYRSGGLPLALLAIVISKVSLGYFAHTTWMAARPKVIETYPRVRAIDAWVGAQLAVIRGFKDSAVARIRAAAWYFPLRRMARSVRRHGHARLILLRAWLVKHAGKQGQS